MRTAPVFLSTFLALVLIAASAWANPATEGAKKTTSTTHSSAKSSTHKSSKPATPPVDLNSVSREELLKLPGMTEATADKIIASRPYKSSDELVSKGIMTKAEFDKMHKHLTAKAAPTAAAH